ncbi:CARDB domain-containing protein [Haloarchaeobius sp. TZWSO28]|uniref:CARDB domain-containing protein n=1 Tax=Haloarchaeobius sp. TZWSO28 TaxID=3446119 RepID=UPI003EBD34EA
MSDSRVVAFKESLVQGDTAAAIDRFDGFDDAVDEQERREGALRDVARGLIARTPPGDASHAAAQQFLRNVSTAQQARLKAKYDYALYLQGGPSAEAVADRVDTVITATETVDKAAERMRETGSDVPLAPALTLDGPRDVLAQVGSSIEATYTLSNIGTSAAGGLEVSLDGYDLSVAPSTVESLAPGESAEVTVSGTATEAASEPLVVSVGAQTARTGINILDGDGHLDRALLVLDDITDYLDAIAPDESEQEETGGNGGKGKKNKSGTGANGNGGPSKGYNGLVEKVATAREQIETIRQQIESGDDESVETDIESVQRLMGAFINQTHGWGKTHLSDRSEALLAADAGRVIDELAAAAELV